MVTIKELTRIINKSPKYAELFWILYESKDGITAKELINDHGFNSRVYERLKTFEKAGITKDISTHTETFKYILKQEFRAKTINHMLFFEKILEIEGSILFGDAGEISHKNIFTRRFMNNHSLIGFPKIFNEETKEFNYSELEFNFLDTLIQQLDDVFDALKILKLTMKTREKIERENWYAQYKSSYGLISEKLVINNIVFWFSKVLFELMEQDMHHQKSYNFIYDLCQETMKLAKKHNLWLSKGAYPLKSFAWNNPFVFEMLMFSNPEVAIRISEKNGQSFPASDESFELIKKGNWIFNKNKNISLEKFEKEIIDKAEEQLIKGTDLDVYNEIASSKILEKKSPIQILFEFETNKKFLDNDIEIGESIALMSTQSIIESSDYEKNVELRLDNHFNNYSTLKSKKIPKEIRNDRYKIFEMTMIILDFKKIDNLSLKKIRIHKELNNYFTKDEIECMIKVGKQRGLMWSHWQECEDYLLYVIYDKEGPWYDKFFFDYAGEILKKKFLDEKEFIEEIDRYCKKSPIKGKGAVFEDYVKARNYFEQEKPLLDKAEEKRKKLQKFKHKMEVVDAEEFFKNF